MAVESELPGSTGSTGSTGSPDLPAFKQGLAAARDAALGHAPVGVLSFSDAGAIVFANEQLHRWLSEEDGSLMGRSVDRLLSPASRIFHSTHFFPLLKLHGNADEIHMVLRDSADRRVPVVISAVREAGDGSPASEAVTHCAVMLSAQRKEFEGKLLEAREVAEAAVIARDEFLAVVSHELRTPLSAIFGWVRLLQSGKLDAAMSKRAVDTIERNVQAQSVLIEDLLDVSRIVSGKLRLSPKSIQLAPVVDMAMDAVRPAAQAKDIELTDALDGDAGLVLADPDRVQQIVWNLVSNAVKFTPKGGRVQVTLRRESSRVRIEVSDTGAGIAAEQLPYLFERFWQAPGQDHRSRKGLGLGLSICKNLVEQHGGTIRAHSEGLGMGAVLTVELPLALAANGAGPSSARSFSHATIWSPEDEGGPDPLIGINVLVLDDDADARALMKMLMEGAGAVVEVAASADEALAALKAKPYHVLLSDVGLPDKDGIELIRLLRTGVVPMARHMPAVAVTGRSRPQDRVALLRAGFQGYLSKPVEPAEVVAVVQALTRRDQA
jgi:signal transduction histidine kinase/ActR/RegA family two-component response regulator